LCSPTIRLPWTIKAINDNWKAILVLAIPIFYRTAKAVLERIRKFPLGMELQDSEEEEKKKTSSAAMTPSSSIEEEEDKD